MLGRRNIRPPHFASKVSYSASPQTFAATAMLFTIYLLAAAGNATLGRR